MRTGKWIGMGLAGVVVLAGTAQAGVLYSNDFSSGSTDWTAETGVALSIVNDDGTGGIGGGNAMQILQSTANKEAAVFFTETTLSAAGDYIQFAYDFRFTTANQTTEFKIFTGDDLDNNQNLGHADFFGVSIFLREHANGAGYSYDKPYVLGDVAGNGLHSFSPPLTSGQEQYVYSMVTTVAYVDADTVNYSTTFNGVNRMDWDVDTVAYDDGTGSVDYDFFTYDSFGTRSGAAGDTMLMDNVVITSGTIPEPATMGLLGLGALLTLVIRRFR